MKLLALVLMALIALIQYPLWVGKGSWLRVLEVDQQMQAQREVNQRLQVRNAVLDAEVRDLKQGLDAIEERARSELGMIRQDEIFFRCWKMPADRHHRGLPQSRHADRGRAVSASRSWKNMAAIIIGKAAAQQVRAK
jgi:cell division protein FtsB